ncbi:hypothetical protein VNI00_012406 [Paramarasmius palmivorus]|uniref:Cytochrome P450 n=1 Tax=Paramarasmius palmivorus TaxID=297713 RepID=A0AAW0C8N0_9AGAR
MTKAKSILKIVSLERHNIKVMDTRTGLVVGIFVVFVTSRIIKFFNALRTVNYIPGYRPPFAPLDFPGVVLPTKWWNTGIDVHFTRRHDMYKEREYLSIVPFISGVPDIWTNNLEVAKQIESGGPKGLFFKPITSSRALRYRLVWNKTKEIYKEMVSGQDWAAKSVVEVDPVQSITYKLALILVGTCGFGLPGSWSEPPRTQDSNSMTVQGALRLIADSVTFTLFAPKWLKALPLKWIQESHDAHVELSVFMKEQIELRKATISSVPSQAGHESDQSDAAVKNNLLNLLVQASEDEEGKYKLDDEELIGNVFLLLLAGHGRSIPETTANALAGTFGYLAANPKVQEEIYEHIINVVGRDRDIEFEDYGNLNKVMSAFVETVRLLPGGHILIREAAEDTVLEIPADPKVDPEGAKLGQKESIPISQGTQVVVDMIGIHRNPRYFEDPEEYKPSRWYDIPNDSELFTGFSVGPRACIGRKFATTEAICFLALLLRDWRISPLLRNGEAEDDWKSRCLVPKFSLTLCVANIGVRFTRRTD